MADLFTRSIGVADPRDYLVGHSGVPKGGTPSIPEYSLANNAPVEELVNSGLTHLATESYVDAKIAALQAGGLTTGYRVWLPLQFADQNTALTSVAVVFGMLNSDAYRIPIQRGCKLVNCCVSAQHADTTSPPATWNLEIRKNSNTGAADATFAFSLSPTSNADKTTIGAPTVELPFVGGDRIGLKLTGTSIDGLAGQVVLEFLATE